MSQENLKEVLELLAQKEFETYTAEELQLVVALAVDAEVLTQVFNEMSATEVKAAVDHIHCSFDDDGEALYDENKLIIEYIFHKLMYPQNLDDIEDNATEDCAENCTINHGTLRCAAIYSPLNFNFMLNQLLNQDAQQIRRRVDFGYLTNELVDDIFENDYRMTIAQNIEIVVKCTMKIRHTMANNEYLQGIMDLFYNIMINTTFDAFFSFIKQLITILLDSNDWKHFLTSKLINKNVLNKTLSKLNDKLWCKLLKTMCDSYDNPQLLNQYDDNNNDTNESKENQSNCDYCCNQDHLMCNMNGKHSGKCILCDELCNMIEYQCIQCDEYVCKKL